MKYLSRSISCLLLISGLLLNFKSNAQTFQLNGRVINSKNESIAGATVNVAGSNKAFAADVEGRFVLKLDASKKHTVEISAAGYNSKLIEDVEGKAGEVNDLLVTLEDKTLAQVTVRTSVRKESTASLLSLQRNNTAVSSGIAADFIKRTPDRTTADALKRVSGTSIQDNRFVIIRGLSDRYNAAFINNAQLPSSEPDRKAFSFDVIPAGMIDNIIINKTATPELTGEFAGGLVQVQTKDIPSKAFASVGVQFGYNFQSTFRSFQSNERGATDWLGFDDGRRDLPAAFPQSAQYYRSLITRSNGLEQQLDLTRSFRNDVYTTVTSDAAPLQTYNFSIGTVKRSSNGASFGMIASALYRRSQLIFDVDRLFSQNDGSPIFDFKDRQNRYQVSTGAMLNLTYSQRKNKLSFKNLFNQFYEDNYFTRTGINTNRLQNIQLNSSFLNQRSFVSTQLEGEHQLTNKVKFKWNSGYALVTRKQPDLRTSQYVQPVAGGQYEVDQDDTRRFFSDLEDHSLSANGSLSVPFQLLGQKQQLKIGGSSLLRFRNFKSRIFRYVPASINNFEDKLVFLPYAKIFAPENIQPKGFVLEEFTNNEDKYFGISVINAGFLMFDNKLSDDIRLAWGVRTEFFEQFLRTKDRSAKQIVINKEVLDILPSLNLSWTVNASSNLRLGAYKTVARPEFREIAPFAFFDYEQNYGISGNPDLKRTSIYNADLRYEIYPKAGEAISFGGFIKRFVEPIEFRLDPGSNADRRLYFYQNAKDANTYGLELEFRKGLGFISSASFFNSLSLFGNLTYIFSEVTFADEISGSPVSANRPIQGQSPYLINGGLQYTNPANGWTASLLYNRVGERLALVGNADFPDIYERPRNLVDFQLTRKILKKKGELKIQLADLLNNPIYLYENLNTSKAFQSGSDRLFSQYRPGASFSVGFTYDFDL